MKNVIDADDGNGHHHDDDEDDDDDYSDTRSLDSCEEYINFESIRNPSTQLEESISFSWPGIFDDEVLIDGDVVDDTTSSSTSLLEVENREGERQRKLRKMVLSTLLEEDDIAPLFDGATWAGTRLWRAAIRSIQYLAGHLPDAHVHPNIRLPRKIIRTSGCSDDNETKNDDDDYDVISILELGCGLGVPGMIFHLLGCNVVLTDQIDILSQLQKNVDRNFSTPPFSSMSSCEKEGEQNTTSKTSIQAFPLSWSREDVRSLLERVGRSDIGFDIVLNCDCVYEPLYGKR